MSATGRRWEYCKREESARSDWGVLSSIILRGGESPLQGEGLDGST